MRKLEISSEVYKKYSTVETIDVETYKKNKLIVDALNIAICEVRKTCVYLKLTKDGSEEQRVWLMYDNYPNVEYCLSQDLLLKFKGRVLTEKEQQEFVERVFEKDTERLYATH